MAKATQQDVRETEYMSLADGVGIIPEQFRNGAYEKLGAEPGTMGILLDDDESRARRGTQGAVDENRLGAAIGNAIGAHLGEIHTRLDAVEAAATEPEPEPEPKKTGTKS